jgi:hypothetical protein
MLEKHMGFCTWLVPKIAKRPRDKLPTGVISLGFPRYVHQHGRLRLTLISSPDNELRKTIARR